MNVTKKNSSTQPSGSQRHLIPPSFWAPDCDSRYEQILTQRNIPHIFHFLYTKNRLGPDMNFKFKIREHLVFPHKEIAQSHELL